MHRTDVRARGPEATPRTLPDGNQQKLVVARELDGSPSALVTENPTRGLDVAAAAAVHDGLLEARNAGAAVVVLFDGVTLDVHADSTTVGQAMLEVR